MPNVQPDHSVTAIVPPDDEYSLQAQAYTRYHTDAEFHAEVYRAVQVTVGARQLPVPMRDFAQEVATVAVAYALNGRDNGS